MKPITQQLKRFSDDERAVSPVVGFVLIFALIMIVFTMYQASVVPAQNEQVEFKHSQTVEAEMSQLNDAIGESGSSGVPQSVTIDTGVQYPDRALAINPGSPAGTLETVDVPNVTLSGVSDGSGYWDTDPSFETHLIEYQSNYNLLQQEPKYVLENGMFVETFENGNSLLESNGSVISNEGRRINLVLVGGTYQKSAMTATPIVTPVSTGADSLQFTADDSGVITLPTTLSKTQWKQILDGKQYVSLKHYSDAGDFDTVSIGLQSNQTYELRITKVSLGGADSPEVAYLKPESRTNRTVAVGTRETFTVSARDEFGNPYPGATVTVNTTGGGTVTPVSQTRTDSEGRATFTYTPVAEDVGNDVTVDLTLTDSTGTVDTVSYDLTIPPQENTSGAESIGVGDIDNGYTTGVVTASVSNSKRKVILGFENIGNETMTAKRVRVNGFLQNSANSVSPPNVSFNGTLVQLNGNVTPLDTGSEYTIPAGGTRSVPLDFQTDIKKGGFLIISVEYIDELRQTDTATYAVAVTGS